MATERQASVVWQGDLMNGSGTIAEVPSGAFGPARRLVGVARRGAERQDEPRGADRRRVGVVLRDGALARPREAGQPAREARDVGDRHVPARRRAITEGALDACAAPCRRPRRGRASRTRRRDDAKENCPVSKALPGDPRRQPRRTARELALQAAMAGTRRRWSRSSSAPTPRRRSGMSDPAVYNDHREAADVGRRAEGARGAVEARAAVAAGARRPRRGARRRRARRDGRRLRGRRRAARGGAEARARRARPRRREGRDRRDPPGRRRRRGGALGRRPRADAAALRRAARLHAGRRSR